MLESKVCRFSSPLTCSPRATTCNTSVGSRKSVQMASLVVPLFLTPPARAIGRARRITHMSAACASSSTASSSSEQQQRAAAAVSSSSEQQQQRVASNSSREQQQQQQAAAAIAAAVVNSTYPPVGPYIRTCISQMYIKCISHMYISHVSTIYRMYLGEYLVFISHD